MQIHEEINHQKSRSLVSEQESMSKLMGLAVFGERVAAKAYLYMADLKPEYSTLLRKFATMEGKHGTWFSQASQKNGFEPDKAFADNELGYLISQLNEHFAQGDFDALAVLQGFIVECLAIATYEPFIEAGKKYAGMEDLFRTVLAEEHYHVDWVTRYLRLRYFDSTDEFLKLTHRVNIQGVDCVGGTLMNITDYLHTVGIAGADCAGAMADGYSTLLEKVGVPSKDSIKSVVSLFTPLMRKYRRGEKTK